MKKKFKLLLLLLLSVVAFQCSDEMVEPQSLDEDLTTSANLYEDQYFTLAITTVQYPDEPMPELFTFYVQGNGGKVSINWGDGTIEKLIVLPSITKFQHQYDRVKNYTIKMSGDIKTITSFQMHYLGATIKDIHFGGLVNLMDVNMGFIGIIPGVINLSRNRNLETVTVADLRTLKDVLLPSTNKLIHVDISGDNQMTTAAVDRVIARVHDSVVNNPREGYFRLGVDWGEDSAYVGPPSTYSINKLRKLRDVYGWTIYPDLQ
jgi:hypothetical protein